MKYKKTWYGPILVGTIDPEVLKQWHDEDPLDPFRQEVSRTILLLNTLLYESDKFKEIVQ